MRIARTLLLAALATIAAFAFAASNASAQVHVEQEISPDAMADCDPCEIHAESHHGETSLIHKQLGQPISTCHDEIEGEIYEDGQGHVQLTEAEGPRCAVTPCQGPEAEWPIQVTEAAGNKDIYTTFCVRLFGGEEVHCELEVDLVDEGTHHWVVGSPERECQTGPVHGTALPIMVVGWWELEYEDRGHVNIEIAH
jgi:hypothetical protein